MLVQPVGLLGSHSPWEGKRELTGFCGNQTQGIVSVMAIKDQPHECTVAGGNIVRLLFIREIPHSFCAENNSNSEHLDLLNIYI